MNNRKYYSFERNNYYYGKLLTSKDFQSEQSYMNGKRRLLSSTLHGMGIVYGLGVVAADDSSVILQSGLALDGAGREITVSKTQVIKLSTVDGFDKLKTDTAYLGIEYVEETTDPVYTSLGDSDGGSAEKYNHLKESYRLYLKDANDVADPAKKVDAYISSKIIYADEDIRVYIKSPSFCVPGKVVKVTAIIEKISHNPTIINIAAPAECEKFVEKTFTLAADNISLEYGQTYETVQYIHPENYIFGNEDAVIVFKGIEIVKSGVKNTPAGVSIAITPVKDNILKYVCDASHKGTLDVDLDEQYEQKLYIAKIHLLRSESHVLIDKILQVPFGQYVTSSEQLMILKNLDEYLVDEIAGKSESAVVNNGNVQERIAYNDRTANMHNNSSGVFEMSLANGGEVGKVYFSDEIMHGLGNGPVYVEIGIEYISNDSRIDSNKESIILGDGSIFATGNSGNDKIIQVDQAIKILPERGTFIVGIRPKVKMGKIGLRIRWYAFKSEDIEQRVKGQKEQKGCIMIQPDTIVVSPKGSVHIEPVFINMPKEALTYTLVDPEGGSVDNNGLYTAPAQEGVYEVKVEVLSKPEIFSHAFMIVSQKRNDD